MPLRNWTFTCIEFRLKQPPGAGAYCGGRAPGPPGTPVGVWGWRGAQGPCNTEGALAAQAPSQKKLPGFPGGAVVENLSANSGDTGSSPGLGRSHMPRSSWAREPRLLSLRVWSLCPATGEAATVRGPRTAMKSGPHLPQLEKALAQKRRPDTAKNK